MTHSFSSLYIFQDTLVPIVYSFVSDPFHKNKPLPFLSLFETFSVQWLLSLFALPSVSDSRDSGYKKQQSPPWTLSSYDRFSIFSQNLPESALCCDIFLHHHRSGIFLWSFGQHLLLSIKIPLFFLNYIYQNKCLLFLLSLPVFLMHSFWFHIHLIFLP